MAAGWMRHLWFGLFSVGLLLLFARPLTRWLAITQDVSHYSHLILVPLVSAFLLWRHRARIFRDFRYDPSGLTGFVAAAIVLAFSDDLTAAIDDGITWKLLSLLLFWLGGWVLFYGRGSFKTAAFPLLFLLFALPLPEAIFEWVVETLQMLSVEATALFLNLSGVPYFRQGTIFTLPRFTIDVARECSGIRSAFTLVVLGVLLARIALRSNWTRVVLSLGILPITVLQNGLRIVTITLLAIYVDDRFLTAGSVHNLSGTVFFGITLFSVVLPATAFLRRLEDPPRSRAGR